ncbi:hypothetical protein [Microbacterium sp. GXF0217]
MDQLFGDDSEGLAPSGSKFVFRTDPFRVHGVDVVHLTDIELVIGDRSGSERRRVRRAKRFAKLLQRRRIALVRTADGADERRLPSQAEIIVDDAAATVISLLPLTAADRRQRVFLGHSHLRDRFLGFPREDTHPGRIVFIAQDTLDPGYEVLLKIFGVAELPGWRLRVAGRVPVELESSYARTLADHLHSISHRDEDLSDAARVSEVSQAEIVAVASPQTYEGQSILMLALSLDRPVLVEDSAHTRALGEEIGASWVRRYPGPLTAHAFETTLAELRLSPPVGRPHLESRDPNMTSARYAAIYRDAAAGR